MTNYERTEFTVQHIARPIEEGGGDIYKFTKTGVDQPSHVLVVPQGGFPEPFTVPAKDTFGVICAVSHNQTLGRLVELGFRAAEQQSTGK